MAEVSKIEKPIGGVGCCESRMAERSHWWTDRWLRSSLFLSFFHSFSDYLPTYLPIYLFIYLSVYIPTYLPTYLPIYLSIYLSIYLLVCLSVYLPVYLQAWKPSYSTRLILFFKVDNIKNAAVLRDFLIFQSWRHQTRRRSNSARLPLFLNLTTSKTKQFCETSSCFKVDNIKNAAILRDFLVFWSWQHHKRSNSARLLHFLNWTTSKTKQFCETSFKNGKLSAELTASYQCGLRFFQSTCRKYCACHEKVMPGHTKCCTCHAKSFQQTWRSDAPKCNPSQEISALTS